MLKFYYANTELLNDKAVFDEYFVRMNIQRREKILRCKKEEDKKRSLLAGIILKYALEKEGMCYEKLEFSKDGKPVLINYPEIHFSISHSNTYVGCVVSDVAVGLDIEYLYRSLFSEGKEYRLSHLAEKTLTEEEQKRFFSCSENERNKVYLEYWTKKESYSKADGKGLQMDFSKIDTEGENFWSVWTKDNYCISIYSENKEYKELFIEEIKDLS